MTTQLLSQILAQSKPLSTNIAGMSQEPSGKWARISLGPGVSSRSALVDRFTSIPGVVRAVDMVQSSKDCLQMRSTLPPDVSNEACPPPVNRIDVFVDNRNLALQRDFEALESQQQDDSTLQTFFATHPSGVTVTSQPLTLQNTRVAFFVSRADGTELIEAIRSFPGVVLIEDDLTRVQLSGINAPRPVVAYVAATPESTLRAMQQLANQTVNAQNIGMLQAAVDGTPTAPSESTPPPGTTPYAPTAFPTWGYVALGAAGLLVLGGIGYMAYRSGHDE